MISVKREVNRKEREGPIRWNVELSDEVMNEATRDTGLHFRELREEGKNIRSVN